jgi:hypothetical protein
MKGGKKKKGGKVPKKRGQRLAKVRGTAPSTKSKKKGKKQSD